jgi:hypothetical protein
VKILAIRGCNLASLAGEFEIDLAHGALADAGVFARLWGRDHAEPPGDAVLAGFDRLLAEVHGDREDTAS